MIDKSKIGWRWEFVFRINAIYWAVFIISTKGFLLFFRVWYQICMNVYVSMIMIATDLSVTTTYLYHCSYSDNIYINTNRNVRGKRQLRALCANSNSALASAAAVPWAFANSGALYIIRLPYCCKYALCDCGGAH